MLFHAQENKNVDPEDVEREFESYKNETNDLFKSIVKGLNSGQRNFP
jgi:hypothetical protein